MTYFHLNHHLPGAPVWLFHLPTLTLAEMVAAALPDGGDLLTIQATSPPADETIASFAAALQSLYPPAPVKLTVITSASFPAPLPHHVILFPVDPATGGALIYYPEFGMAAGILGNGEKIPPAWRNPEAYNPAQRTAILNHAADTLLSAIAAISQQPTAIDSNR